MTLPVHITKWRCTKCQSLYDTDAHALVCEAVPVTKDRGVKLGDEVLILNGDGAGKYGVVTKVSIADIGWGPSFIHHTVVLEAKVVGGYGSRLLMFTDYQFPILNKE